MRCRGRSLHQPPERHCSERRSGTSCGGFSVQRSFKPVRGKDFLSARSGTTAEDGVFIPPMVLLLQTVLGEFLGLQGRSQHIVEPSRRLQEVP